MDLTLNHINILEETIKVVLDKYGFLNLPYCLKYKNEEYRNEPRLIITHLFAGGAFTDAGVFEFADIIDKVNDVSVKTLDEFRQAIKLSKETGYITIQTEDNNNYVSVPVKDILQQERSLSDCYGFVQSSLIEDLK